MKSLGHHCSYCCECCDCFRGHQHPSEGHLNRFAGNLSLHQGPEPSFPTSRSVNQLLFRLFINSRYDPPAHNPSQWHDKPQHKTYQQPSLLSRRLWPPILHIAIRVGGGPDINNPRVIVIMRYPIAFKRETMSLGVPLSQIKSVGIPTDIALMVRRGGNGS